MLPFTLLGFYVLSHCLSAKAVQDATLPVLNVKYDFPSSDFVTSGPRAQDAVAFTKRVQRAAERINHDSEVLMDVRREARQNLDKLALVFARGASSTNKTVQFLELAGSAKEVEPIVPPGIRSGLYGDIAGNSDFELNLVPPEMQTRDTQEQLDGLMVLEEAKHAASEAALVAEQRHMLNVEKGALQELVHAAFSGSRPAPEAMSVQFLEADKGRPGGSYGETGGRSGVELNLEPPGGAHDVGEALDAILKVEEGKYESARDSMSAAKQRLLNTEKGMLRGLVHAAFKPLMGKNKAVS